MWSPTHTQVTVQRARGLLTKGKNGTNNCFVTIALGKEKYQTSIKEKAEMNVNWNEECELKIPDQGNRAELVLTCLHHNNLGIDEFLGQVTLPLNEMDVYDRPRSKWYKLESKPGKEKRSKERGELEVRIAFVVKSGSLTDLSKKDKHKSSIGQLASSVGGSLLSIGTIEKRKGIKKFAKSLGSKMHLSNKKKNKDGDDTSSFSGSFVSIGTPNSSNGGGGIGGGGGSGRRFGQRAGDADPGVISEDEDEFVFDNLSHKSSGSSLNIQRTGLQPPTPNFTPRNPSPLLNNGNGHGNVSALIGAKLNSKFNGGKPKLNEDIEDQAIVFEMEQLELDYSVRARTLPPPSKPPRTPYSSVGKGDAIEGTLRAETVTTGSILTDKVENFKENAQMPEPIEPPKLDEWESKLYGGKYLDVGNTDSLKRRSWELAPVPLPTSNEIELNVSHSAQEKETNLEPITETKQIEKPNSATVNNTTSSLSASSTSDSDSDEDKMAEQLPLPSPAPIIEPPPFEEQRKPVLHKLEFSRQQLAIRSRSSLISPNEKQLNFDDFNASFAKFEQQHSSKIFENDDLDHQHHVGDDNEKLSIKAPQAKPRGNKNTDIEPQQKRAAEAAITAASTVELAQRRAEEDARLEAELRQNEQRLREEEEAMERELEEQERRQAKRREEDQKLLNFAKLSTSTEDDSVGKKDEHIEHSFLTLEQSPKEFSTNGVVNYIGNANSSISGNERREKRLGKFKYQANKRDKYENESNSPSPKSNERIIIGHEKSVTHAERRSEISAALSKKYEGKSREELMLIANGMENEALLQRQRVKELEDYLDNLLLRVMETHPKILQNPYSRTTSAKSG